jgi:hypothetical protein
VKGDRRLGAANEHDTGVVADGLSVRRCWKGTGQANDNDRLSKHVDPGGNARTNDNVPYDVEKSPENSERLTILEAPSHKLTARSLMLVPACGRYAATSVAP